MNVVVLVKQIADPSSEAEPQVDTTWLAPVVGPILDDTDRYGVELALQVAESSGGTVTVLSLGAAQGDDGVREALAIGAEQAVVIDADAEGAGVLTTARAFAAQLAQQEYDLVVAGTASTDGSSGLLPQMLGELLGVPAITNATEVTVTEGAVRAHRQTAAGYDVVTASLPAVVAVTAGAVEPRYPSFKGSMAAKRKQIPHIGIGDLVPDRQADATQRVIRVAPAPTRAAGMKIEDTGEAHEAIVQLLAERGAI